MTEFEHIPLRCPCCGYKTLSERAAYDICKVCFWEDDGQDDSNASEIWGGPNGDLGLAQARVNYKLFGACCEKDILHVRPPRPSEL